MSYYWFLTSFALINANFTTVLNTVCVKILELFKISLWKQQVRSWIKTFSQMAEVEKEELFQHDWVYTDLKTGARAVTSGYS